MEKLKPHPFNMFFFAFHMCVCVCIMQQQQQHQQMIVRVLTIRYAWPNMSKVVPFTLKN